MPGSVQFAAFSLFLPGTSLIGAACELQFNIRSGSRSQKVSHISMGPRRGGYKAVKTDTVHAQLQSSRCNCRFSLIQKDPKISTGCVLLITL